MLLETLYTKLKKVSSGIKKAAQKVLTKNQSFIVNELRKHSPKDTGRFASNWKATSSRISIGKELAGLVITNDTPIYGRFMEFGAEPGQAPWYFPHRDKKGQMRKGSGKLKLDDGKVWAGGKDPGHGKTVGGAIKRVISDRNLLDRLTREITNEGIRGILS